MSFLYVVSHPKLDATTLSVSAHTQLYALGTRQGVYIYNIQDALIESHNHITSPPCIQTLYNDHTPLSVALFNPHYASQSLIATASCSTNNLYLWNLNYKAHPLQSHNTNISVADLCWSTTHTQQFATIALQSTATPQIWDIRDAQTPALTLPTTTTTTTTATSSSSAFVRYHPSISYHLAVSHHNTINIYDLRHPDSTTPLCFFSSPLSTSLCSLDWSRWDQRQLAAGDEQQQIQFWNINTLQHQPDIGNDNDDVIDDDIVHEGSSPSADDDDHDYSLSHDRSRSALISSSPQYKLQTKQSLCAARYTPFGHGLITFSNHHDSSLRLWNIPTKLGESSVHVSTTSFGTSSSYHYDHHHSHQARHTDIQHVQTIVGHTDPIRCIDWLSTSSSQQNNQLWTWSENRLLRIYELSSVEQRLIESEYQESPIDIGITTTPSSSSSSSSFAASLSSIASVRAELSECEQQYPTSFRFMDLNSIDRTCQLIITSIYSAPSSSSSPSLAAASQAGGMISQTHQLFLHVHFPLSYPYIATPVFTHLPSSANLFCSLSPQAQLRLMHHLSTIAERYVNKQQPSLLACVGLLHRYLDHTHSQTRTNSNTQRSLSSPSPRGGKRVRISGRTSSGPEMVSLRNADVGHIESYRHAGHAAMTRTGRGGGVASASTPSLSALTRTRPQRSRGWSSGTSPGYDQNEGRIIEEDEFSREDEEEEEEESNEDADREGEDDSHDSLTPPQYEHAAGHPGEAVEESSGESDEDSSSVTTGGVATVDGNLATVIEASESQQTARLLSAANTEADERVQRAKLLNAVLPCPRLSALCWGPRGELIMISNFPQLTHYLHHKRNTRRPSHTQQPTYEKNGLTTLSSLSSGSPLPADLDEDEWNDTQPTPGNAKKSADENQPSHDDADEIIFPPRTYAQLLHLPFTIDVSFPHDVVQILSAHQTKGEATLNGIKATTDDDIEAPHGAHSSTGPMDVLTNGQSTQILHQDLNDRLIVSGASVDDAAINVSDTDSEDEADGTHGDGIPIVDLNEVPIDSLASLSQQIVVDGTNAAAAAASFRAQDDHKQEQQQNASLSETAYNKNHYLSSTTNIALNAAATNEEEQEAEEFFASFFHSEIQPTIVNDSTNKSTMITPFASFVKRPSMSISTIPPATETTVSNAGSSTLFTSNKTLGVPTPLTADNNIKASSTSSAIIEASQLSGHELIEPQHSPPLIATSSSSAVDDQPMSPFLSRSQYQQHHTAKATDVISSTLHVCNTITMIDLSSLFPVDSELARSYTLSAESVSEVCSLNETAAYNRGRTDLVRMWQLLRFTFSPSIQEHGHYSLISHLTPRSQHVLGGRLIERMIKEYWRQGDLQTVAMISCVASFHRETRMIAPLEPLLHINTMRSRPEPITTTITKAPSPSLLAPSPQPNDIYIGRPIRSISSVIASSTTQSQMNQNQGMNRILSSPVMVAGNGPLPRTHSDSITSNNTIHEERDEATNDNASMTKGGRLRRSVSDYEDDDPAAPPSWLLPSLSSSSSLLTTTVVLSPSSPSSSSSSSSWANDISSSSSSLLIPFSFSIYRSDLLKLVYVEYLDRLQVLESKTKIMKFLQLNHPNHQQQQNHNMMEAEEQQDTKQKGGPALVIPSRSDSDLIVELFTGMNMQDHVMRIDPICQYCGYLPSFTKPYNIHTTTSRDNMRIISNQSQSSPNSNINTIVVASPLSALPFSSPSISPASKSSPSSVSTTPQIYPRRVPSAPSPIIQNSSSSNASNSVRCIRCNHYSVHCILCGLSVRGLSLFCLICGHGGHLDHMRDWFFNYAEKECPTGCGCQCIVEMEKITG